MTPQSLAEVRKRFQSVRAANCQTRAYSIEKGLVMLANHAHKISFSLEIFQHRSKPVKLIDAMCCFPSVTSRILFGHGTTWRNTKKSPWCEDWNRKDPCLIANCIYHSPRWCCEVQGLPTVSNEERVWKTDTRWFHTWVSWFQPFSASSLSHRARRVCAYPKVSFSAHPKKRPWERGWAHGRKRDWTGSDEKSRGNW